MVTFVRDFIVQNTIQELNFERKYEGQGSMMWVLAVVGILLVCFIIVLFYIANLKEKSKGTNIWSWFIIYHYAINQWCNRYDG